VAGFDAGNRSDYSVISGSGEHAVLNLCQTSNVGIPGVWRFSIHRGLPNFCGDGALSDEEECDEGPLNANAPDACRTTCQLPVCGDGIVDTGEECDAGASNSDTRPDGCRIGCTAPVCGDGVVDTGEACDNGAANSDEPGAGCLTNCQIAVRTRPTPDVPVPQIGPIEVPPSDPVAMERSDRIWGQRRRPILLNRRYLKAGRHELGLFGGVVPNHPFLEYYPVGLRYDVFISESLGIELDGAYIGEVFRRSSNLRDFLQRHDAGPPVDDVSLWRAHLGVQWSPFYSKIAFLGQKLLHFDMGLYAGLGAVGAGRLEPGGDLVDESVYLEGAVGVGLRVFLGRHAALRIEARQLLSESTSGGLAHPVEITGGIGFFFP
jgi:outer membrane beta-barrel protein